MDICKAHLNLDFCIRGLPLLLQYALKINFSKCIEGKTLKVKGGKFGFQLSVIPSVSFNKRAAQSFTHDSLCFGAIQSILIIH